MSEQLTQGEEIIKKIILKHGDCDTDVKGNRIVILSENKLNFIAKDIRNNVEGIKLYPIYTVKAQ